VHWLARSHLLQPLGLLASTGTTSTTSTTSTSSTSSSATTRFEHLLHRWRCGLCGRHAGITVRCCAAGCAVRAHALCAQLAGPGWMLCSVTGAGQGAGLERGKEQEQGWEAPGLLCCSHSNQPLLN